MKSIFKDFLTRRTMLAATSACVGLLAAAPQPAAAWSEKLIHSFGLSGNGSVSENGTYPSANLIIDATGDLYSTTTSGGHCDSFPQYGCGLVLELVAPTAQGRPWTEKVLHRFALTSAKDGKSPHDELIMDAGGHLFGTTTDGGANCGGSSPGGCGTAFELSPPPAGVTAWTEKILHNFGNAGDNAWPSSGLTADAEGNLYGATTRNSGTRGGAVFKLTRPSAAAGAWKESTLAKVEGAGTLIFGPDGSLYGEAANGKTKVFELAPPTTAGAPWTETFLQSFSLGNLSGVSLVMDGKGNLFGPDSGSYFGGRCANAGCGTVFELTPPSRPGGLWQPTVLYTFGAFAGDGKYPRGNLTMDTKGNLYGTTLAGGSDAFCNGGCGVAFELSPPAAQGGSWTETILHKFGAYVADAQSPQAGVVMSGSGQLFGTAFAGGEYGGGAVFELIP